MENEMDALTDALKLSQGQIVVRAGSTCMTSNKDGEWVVFNEHLPPRLLYRGTDHDTAVKCLVSGKMA